MILCGDVSCYRWGERVLSALAQCLNLNLPKPLLLRSQFAADDDAERGKKGRLGGFDIEFRGLSTVITSGNINNMCAGA